MLVHEPVENKIIFFYILPENVSSVRLKLQF